MRKSVEFGPCAKRGAYSRDLVSEKILARDPMEEIRRAFQLFDDDNTGKINLKNLRRVAKEIGDRLEDDELCVYQTSAYLPLADSRVSLLLQTSYD